MPDATPRFELTKLLPSHGLNLLLKMREEDYEEWTAAAEAHGVTVSDAMVEAIKHEHSKAILIDGVAHVAMGVNEGMVWLCATDKAALNWRAIHRRYKAELHAMAATNLGALSAYSIATNTVHHKWLLKMGFKLLRRQADALGTVWHHFVWEAPTCAPLSS